MDYGERRQSEIFENPSFIIGGNAPPLTSRFLRAPSWAPFRWSKKVREELDHGGHDASLGIVFSRGGTGRRLLRRRCLRDTLQVETVLPQRLPFLFRCLNDSVAGSFEIAWRKDC